MQRMSLTACRLAQLRYRPPRLQLARYTTPSLASAPPRQSLFSGNRNDWTTYENLTTEATQQLTRDDFVQLRSALWKSKQWGAEDRVLQVLQDMKKLGHEWTVLEYNEYFGAMLYQARYQELLDTYRGPFKESGFALTSGSFNVLLATFIQLGMQDDAIRLISEASSHQLSPDIHSFSRTMHRCMPRNTAITAKARELIAEYGFEKTETLNFNLHHLFSRRSFDDIAWVYEREKAKQRPFDVSTYGMLIRGYADARRPQLALSVYDDMRKANVAPNAPICISLLSIYAHQRNANAAEALVKAYKGKLDAAVCNQLMRVYLKTRHLRKAFKVFEYVQKTDQMNDIVINTMIDGLVMNREINAALSLYQQLLNTRIKPDMITFNTLLKGTLYEGKFDVASQVISDMYRHNHAPDHVTMTIFLDAIFDAQKPRNTLDLLAHVRQAGIQPNIYTYNVIINRWIQDKRMNEAERTFELLKADNCEPTVHTYTNLIQGYARTGDLPKMFETLQQMRQSRVRPDRATYHFLLTAVLDHGGGLDAAVQILQHWRQKEGGQPVKDTWSVLLDECRRRQDWVNGSKVLAELESSGFVITSKSLQENCNAIKAHAAGI
ncbi:hypothetical protein BCR43DRAFT_490260 [Syncephalastrum racemosum]|uniref:Pentacotripeptide-repeat region of PRORP domain-containing protein n=1 Tax=Syncephalastrum racemosum TaxID=13706 RepID=A0A1X2HFQ0_SYNRA|nr:hypothetical protein BCR43DRAFT_490260 [Syncephalastrum racemosum]